eukprot:699769-Amphidinium_carterae.1
MMTLNRKLDLPGHDVDTQTNTVATVRQRNTTVTEAQMRQDSRETVGPETRLPLSALPLSFDVAPHFCPADNPNATPW